MKHKRQLFINEFVKCGNATEAAIAAGYSEKTARSSGNRLLTNVDIMKAINEAQEKIRKDTDITITDLVRKIVMLSISTKSENVKLKAFDMLMKHLGGYINELSIISKMSDDDLEKLSNKLMSKLS